jgi:hypothetical protein
MQESISLEDPVSGQRKSVGRPTKKTKAIVKRLFDGIKRGVPYEMACELAGISAQTFYLWRQRDAAFDAEVLKVTRESTFALLDTILEARHENWQAAATLLERRWARYYGRAEAQLNFLLAVQNNNGSAGANSISITLQEANEIENTAEPVRESVKAMFVSYRPQVLGNGDKGTAKPVVEVEATEICETPIERRPSDEKRPEFWAQFIGGRDRLVEVSTAIFVVKTIVGEVIGAYRVGKVEFKEPVSVGDCLDRIDQLVGVGSAAGWQRIQKKAGY